MVVSPRRLSRERLERAPRGETKIKGGGGGGGKKKRKRRGGWKKERRGEKGKKRGAARGRAFQHVDENADEFKARGRRQISSNLSFNGSPLMADRYDDFRAAYKL